MMRGPATLLSAVVVVFSLTFVGARLSAAPAPAAAPQLAAAPKRPSGERLCACAAWLLPTGGAPASPRTGRC